MSDVIYVAAMIAFFLVMALYVRFCDRLIGPDDPSLTDEGSDSAGLDSAVYSYTAGAGESEVTV